jgi:hypothetical protein
MFVYDESAAYSDSTPAASVPNPNQSTAADFLTEAATYIDTGEWIPVSNPGSSMNDLASNIWTGQPTQNQMDLSAQAAAQQMAQAGGSPAQQSAAAAEALKQMQDNPAPNSPGFFGLSAEAWIMLAVVAAAALFFVKK